MVSVSVIVSIPLSNLVLVVHPKAPNVVDDFSVISPRAWVSDTARNLSHTHSPLK